MTVIIIRMLLAVISIALLDMMQHIDNGGALNNGTFLKMMYPSQMIFQSLSIHPKLRATKYTDPGVSAQRCPTCY